jgi:hypothetical protein
MGMADGASVQILAYTSDLLKFVAVPFAVMELFERERRKEVEQRIIKRTKSSFHRAILVCVATLVSFYLLVNSAPYLIAVYFGIYLIIHFGTLAYGMMSSKYGEDIMGFNVAFNFAWWAIGIFIFILAFIAWLIPQSWQIGLFYPVEWTLDTLRSANAFWSPLVPEFNTQQFLATYRASVARVDAFITGIWWGLKFSTYLYVLASDGLVFLILLCLLVAFLVFVWFAAVSVVLAPIALFVHFSEALKSRFDATEKGILPLGALVLWAVGETLNILVSTYKFFWAPQL